MMSDRMSDRPNQPQSNTQEIPKQVKHSVGEEYFCCLEARIDQMDYLITELFKKTEDISVCLPPRAVQDCDEKRGSYNKLIDNLYKLNDRFDVQLDRLRTLMEQINI
jgi:3-dehydroquinate dehydratase